MYVGVGMSFLDDLQKIVEAKDAADAAAEERTKAQYSGGGAAALTWSRAAAQEGVDCDEFKSQASECLTDSKDLTEEAKLEADRHRLGYAAYKEILMRAGNSQFRDFSSQMFPMVISEYRRGVVTLEKLLEDKGVNGLARGYGKYKDQIGAEILHVNPGRIEDVYKEDGSVDGVKEVTTFAHALFENKVPKAEIIGYFKKVSELIGGNRNLTDAYMGLSDAGHKSIAELIKEQSLVPEYEGIYEDIVRSTRLFPQERAAAAAAAAGVDTHTGSIHNSVDQSFTRLAKLYDSENVREIEGSSRSVEVTRDAAWDAKIGRGLEDFRREIEGVIKDEESLESFLKPTLAKGEDPTEPKAKFKYHAETAVRLLDGLDKEIFGNVYTIRPKEPVSCGLTPREIVAIAYASLSDKSQWENGHLEKEHLMSFVENMNNANRGYNIDAHGDDEYKTHGADQDNNKCVGGMINQIAEGLKDHKKVTIKVLDVSSMKGPMVSGALAGALRNIVAEEGATSLREDISKWCVGGEVSQALVDEIVKGLKGNPEFSEEFGDDGIVRFSPQVMRALSKEELSEIGKEVFGTKDLGVLEDRLDEFVFGKDEGYISSAESLHERDKAKYVEMLDKELGICFALDGPHSRKGAALVNFLLSSPNEEFVGDTRGWFVESFKVLPKISRNSQFIRSARRGHGALLREILKFNLADINFRYIIEGMDTTALTCASFEGHEVIVKAILENPYCTEKTLNAKDQDDNTAMRYASSQGHWGIVKSIIESCHCTPETLSLQNEDGNTVLMLAILKGKEGIAEMILDHPNGSDMLDAKNIDDKTALELAESQGLMGLAAKISVKLAWKEAAKSKFSGKGKSETNAQKRKGGKGGGASRI